MFTRFYEEAMGNLYSCKKPVQSIPTRRHSSMCGEVRSKVLLLYNKSYQVGALSGFAVWSD